MKDLNQISAKLNILIDFLGKRDLNILTQRELQTTYHLSQVDVAILFGGSIPEGCDVFAKAYQNKLAKHYLIVGGAGHTTDTLRQKMQGVFTDFVTADKAEAEIMNYYLQTKYQINDCLLETESTNCGNNITNALALLENLQLQPKSILFMQDATMQLRMYAGFKKFAPKIELINYATYKLHFTVADNQLALEHNHLWGMWDINRYISLLLGEIPRLHDTKEGYGPQGQNFIAHIDIPEEVLDAFNYLKQNLNIEVRTANAKFASK